MNQKYVINLKKIRTFAAKYIFTLSYYTLLIHKKTETPKL